MGIERLAILGIAVFAFMIAAQAFRVARAARRTATVTQRRQRPRRKVSSETLARQIARGVLQEVVDAHPQLVASARKSGVIPRELEEVLSTAMTHYLGRVAGHCKGYFYQETTTVVLQRKRT